MDQQEHPLAALLREQYGEGYTSPVLAGDSADYDTRDVYARMPNALGSALREAHDVVPANPDHSLSWLNLIRASVGSGANWADRRPEPRDMLLPPVAAGAVNAAKALPSILRTALGDRTLDALKYHLRQINHDEGGWPSRLGKAAFAASPPAVSSAAYPFIMNDPLYASWMAPALLGAGAGVSALSGYAFMRPHYDMVMKKRQYLRDMDERLAAQKRPPSAD